MSGTDPDSPKHRPDRTRTYRPDDAASPPPPVPDNLPKVPGITLHFEIARGGMGVVYSGRQDFLDRKVAVKLLSVELGGESFVQRFQREAKILAGIKHPNIVACHMAGQTDDGQSYLVMEFVDGPSLKKWIGDNGPVPIRAALRTARGVAQALGHAHTLGIIHRDVKPENILLEMVTSTALDITFPFTPKVVDLGLARASSGNASMGLTSPGSVMGTPATMSPEQYDDPDEVDFRSDIYGLGCALFEMLVGLPAFRGKKLSDIVTQKRELIAPDPCQLNADVPAAVGALVQSMLARNRDDRPRSYKELDEQFEALVNALTEPKKKRPIVGEETGATIISQPGRPSKAPPKSQPPKSPPSKTPPPKEHSGPGLLHTGEINFLAEGLGEPGGAQAEPAFHTKPPVGGVPAAPVWATVPPAAPTPAPTPTATLTAAPPPTKARGGLIAAVAIGVIAIAGGGYALFKPDNSNPGPGAGPDKPSPVVVDPKTTTPTSANKAPVVSDIKGPTKAGMREKFSVEVEASDAENDKLTYEWSTSTELLELRGRSDRNKTEFAFEEGLPGVECVIYLDVTDGNTSTRRSHTIQVGQFDAVRSLLDKREWRADKSLAWTENPEDRSIVGAAGISRRELRRDLGAESYWEWVGTVESNNDQVGGKETAYAKVGLQFEFGDRGWMVICHRTGANGAQWTMEAMEIVRSDDKWESRKIVGAVPATWNEPSETEDSYRAMFSVQRRGKQLILKVGEARLPPNAGAVLIETPGLPITVDLPANADNGQLVLFVDQGRGRFWLSHR